MNRIFVNGLKASFFCTLLSLFLAGCQESNQSEIRRAKLVGNENIQLKKQLELKDKQIQELKELIAKCEEEKVRAIDQAGEANLKLLKMLAETSKEKDTLLEENFKLKAQIKEIQDQTTK